MYALEITSKCIHKNVVGNTRASLFPLECLTKSHTYLKLQAKKNKIKIESVSFFFWYIATIGF